MTTIFGGLPAAPGIGLGLAYVHRPNEPTLETMLSSVQDMQEHDSDLEWQRFVVAQSKVELELEHLRLSLNTVAADIFSVHQLILHDKTFTESVREAILINQSNAVTATQQAIQNMAEIFRELEDEYFASRAADIIDIGKRLLTHLGVDLDEVPLSHLPAGTVLVSADLSPSDIAQLSSERVTGIALAESTPTAHSSILARSLGLPLVCGLGLEVLLIEAGQEVVLDGDRGRLVIKPTAEEIARYKDAFALLEEQRTIALTHVQEDAVTRDGTRVPVYINANQPDEIDQSRLTGADGVGLLRTEYLFQNRTLPPSREEQRWIFQGIVDTLAGQPLTVRALDAGGDKPVDFMLNSAEENPFLGRRGIRLLLDHPEILITQYQALLDVASQATEPIQLRYMLPMVSTLEEVDEARRILDETREKILDADGISTEGTINGRTPVEIGVLIEVPSAALMVEQLADKVDFFSIGTNDLAQYVMASDRTNSSVARLADPLHPAVLKLIGHVCRAAKNANLPVSLCGEMAGNPSAVPLLLGLGVTELSVPLPCVPLVKQVVRECNMVQCHQLAAVALGCANAEEVRELLAET
jgi:phosphoenolpyruvate-protein phosphotransferase